MTLYGSEPMRAPTDADRVAHATALVCYAGQPLVTCVLYCPQHLYFVCISCLPYAHHGTMAEDAMTLPAGRSGVTLFEYYLALSPYPEHACARGATSWADPRLRGVAVFLYITTSTDQRVAEVRDRETANCVICIDDRQMRLLHPSWEMYRRLCVSSET